jgi:uncharacterized protein YkwD
MRKFILIIIACLLAFPLLGANISNTQAKATKTPKVSGGNAYDLIAAVNALRSANGLTPYQVNGALMLAAQAHSNYQASIGVGTHDGAGGSRPRDRAAAAGYGGGATIFISENIAWGSSMSVQAAVNIWQGDYLHLNTMLSGNYTDAGAGLASSEGSSYFTLDVGYVSGSPGSGPTLAAGGIAGPTVAPYYPILVSTPMPDGSIVHIVQPGHTLWNIAAVYKVSLPELQNLNNLTNSSVIYINQNIMIKAPNILATPVFTGAGTLESPTSTSPPTPFLAPEVFKTVLTSPTPVQAAKKTPDPSPAVASSSKPDPFLLLIAGLVFGGTTLIILGSIVKKNR